MMESKRLRIRHSTSNQVKTSAQPEDSPQGFATLYVMIAVLTIIVLFCCFAAPGIRDLCKRYVFRCCATDDPNVNNATTATESATPTIILLPYGRMLVVDRSMFSQLQSDHTGIDFMELSANIIRSQRRQAGSTPSILDSDTTSKGVSPSSLGLSPPAYEDIVFDGKRCDLPPSYSQLSLMFRAQTRKDPAAVFGDAPHQYIEMGDVVIDLNGADEKGDDNNNLKDGNVSGDDHSETCVETESERGDEVCVDDAAVDAGDEPSTSNSRAGPRLDADADDDSIKTCYLRESSL